MNLVMRRLFTLALMVTLGGCASPEPQAPQTASNLPDTPDLREEGLLFLMTDRRYFDSFTVGSIRMENPELGVPLAVALGRIGDPRGLPTLQTLLLEGKPEVRREAAFALGSILDAESLRLLHTAVTDADSETGVWAIAGLANQGADLDRIVQQLGTLSTTAKWQRLAPYLFRFPPGEVLPVARTGLGVQQADMHAMIAFALAREPQLEAVEALRSQIGHRDPWVQGWVARALGQVGDRGDLVLSLIHI